MKPWEKGQVTRIINLLPSAESEKKLVQTPRAVKPMVSAVLYPKRHAAIAKSFWQHSGEGISSRRAVLCHRAFNDGFLVHKTEVDDNPNCHETFTGRRSLKGPQRYQKGRSASGVNDDSKLKSDPDPTLSSDQYWLVDEGAQFVEERYGRNLDLSFAGESKRAIRRRIAGALATRNGSNQSAEDVDSAVSTEQASGVSESDVYLFPSGMSSIFNAHRIMMACRGELKSICFGLVSRMRFLILRMLKSTRFPYIDTLKILEKWGPGCQFYGNGSANDLEDLERRCAGGDSFLALFCEFPGNPLLHTPDLRRIRSLADRFNFAVVVDETIGNFLNVHVLPDADVVVSSLTKVFSGDSNVMGGR